MTQVREDENVDGETVAEFVPKISALQNQAQDETTHTVDGRNPAISGMYKSPVSNGGNLPISGCRISSINSKSVAKHILFDC